MDELMAIEFAVAAGAVASNRTRDGRPDLRAVAAGMIDETSEKAPYWTDEEVDFVRNNVLTLSLEEIADALGRSVNAVDIKRDRMGIPVPTKMPGILSARDAADALGMGDSKKVARLIARGVIEAQYLPVNRVIYGISYRYLQRWVIKPENWIYFRFDRMGDPDLKRLVELKKKTWGDDYWTTNQAARYMRRSGRDAFCENTDILRQVRTGRIRGVQDFEYNSNWYVLKSEITDPSFRLYRGKGRSTGYADHWNDQADVYVILARALGQSYSVIQRTTGNYLRGSAWHRLMYMERTGRMAALICEQGLDGVHYRQPLVLWADWREYAWKFPAVARAASKFLAGANLTQIHRDCVRGLLWSWLAWHGDPADPEQAAALASLQRCGRVTAGTLREKYEFIVGWGGDPLGEEGKAT